MKRLPALLTILILLALAGFVGHAVAQTPPPPGPNPPSEIVPLETRFFPLLAPTVTIAPDRIEVYPDYVRLWISGARMGQVVSGSNLPVQGPGTLVLWIPTQPSDLHVGDLILFKYCGSGGIPATAMHQIIRISADGNGWFAITKGINNPIADPCRVREADILGRAVAVVW